MAGLQAKVLVVEDDPNVIELLRLYLQKAGYEVLVAEDGSQAIAAYQDQKPDLVILDVMLPYLSGWEVCRQIRKEGETPVILLTARGESADKILGFELGADDYVVKPFDPQELLARVRAVLRRSRNEKGAAKEGVLHYPGLEVDMNQYRVVVDGETVELAPKEMELLYFLASHPNQVFSREQLLDRVWGYDFLGDSRTVDVHIKNLRKKVDKGRNPWRIATVWGVGYKFEVKPGVP